ncbi:unnamed protein product, partial [Polarella glacialis]
VSVTLVILTNGSTRLWQDQPAFLSPGLDSNLSVSEPVAAQKPLVSHASSRIPAPLAAPAPLAVQDPLVYTLSSKSGAPKGKCLDDLYARPGPIVRSKTDGKELEISFLNRPDLIPPNFRTKSLCRDKNNWRSDGIGRPITLPTARLIARAVEVGHPHNGILDLDRPAPERVCAQPVPRIIHFVWLCKPIPSKVALRVASFARLNPNWKIMVLVDKPVKFTEQMIFHNVSDRPAGPIIIHTLASHAHDFRNMDIIRWIRNLSWDPRHGHVCAGMSDVARLETVYKYGGIYMDSDFIPHRAFDDYGDLFRWPFISHKVCAVNIINSIMGFDANSGYLNFSLEAYRQNCLIYHNCMPEGGAGPAFMAMSMLKYNSSDVMFIGQQFFHDSKQELVSHLTENSWGR